MSEKRDWLHDEIEKFGDIRSVRDRKIDRHLPTRQMHRQTEFSDEITQRRKVDEQFRIKKV